MKMLTSLKEQARADYAEERAALGLPATFGSFKADTVTTCVNGFAGEYPCSNIDLHSVVGLAELGCSAEAGGPPCEGSDIWGWVDSETDHEYALMLTTEGISIVDVTNSLAPLPVAYILSPTSWWQDAKVFNNHMYVVTEGNTGLGGANAGMQVFDLTRVRGRTTLTTMTADVVYTHDGTLVSTHNIVINEDSGFAYLVGTNLCAGGLYMLNLATPLVPEYAGCYAEDGYTHDAQCVMYDGPDTAYVGREICFAYNEDTLTIVDVTDKASPVMISRTGYAGAEYTHQGWLTPDQKFLFLDDELDEARGDASSKATTTYIVDCSSLTTPVFVNTFVSSEDAIDHNQYITNDWYSFQANYMAGLRILDVKDVNNVFETAFFDVDPRVNAAQFFGAWSSYPYFPSGNVVVSSIERGLFVVRPTNLQRPPTSAPTTSPTIAPTTVPTGSPTGSPTSVPTTSPTSAPTSAPTTSVPTTSAPTAAESGFLSDDVLVSTVAGGVAALVIGVLLCTRNKKNKNFNAVVQESDNGKPTALVSSPSPSYVEV